MHRACMVECPNITTWRYFWTPCGRMMCTDCAVNHDHDGCYPALTQQRDDDLEDGGSFGCEPEQENELPPAIIDTLLMQQEIQGGHLYCFGVR